MFRVLGAVEGGEPGVVRGRSQLVLLSALVLDRRNVVSSDRLAELIWGDDQPSNPKAALQNQVSRLRASIPDSASIEAVGSGYRFDPGAIGVDVDAVDAAFEVAGRPSDGSLGHLERALELWRGDAYTELSEDARAMAEITRLRVVRQSLLERRIDLLLEFGRHAEAISELERLRGDDPLQETTVAQLMSALAASGRKRDALTAFQEYREQLADETGLDPSPALRDLESAILTDSFRPENESRSSSPAPPIASAGRSSSVDVPTSSFIGRDADVERVDEALRESRVVTIVGPGGVGKTRLSRHVAVAAEQRGTAVHLVELTATDDPALLGDLLVSALDLRARADVSSTQLVIDSLRARSALLVLDNCEHVIEAAADLVASVSQQAGGVAILATSREPLNIDGERVVRLDRLSTGHAVDLFVDRAANHGAIDPESFDRDLVERIVVALDGLPLAIELAAAKTAAMSLHEIHQGLDERLELLDGGRRTAPSRHRSLRALVEWSMHGLDDRLRSAFVRGSAFASPFTVPAIAHVLDMSEGAARTVVTDLVGRSLLVEQREEGRETRYRYLQTMHAFAREQLLEDVSVGGLTERHSSWVLARVEAARALLPNQPDRDAWRDVMAELADIRIVHRRFLDAGDVDRSLRLTTSLYHLAFFRMHAEMLSWIQEAADAHAEADHPLAEDVLGSASIASWVSGDLERARSYAERSQRRADAGSYPWAGRGAAEAMADVIEFSGDAAGAQHLFDRALSLARVQGDQARIACNLVDGALSRSYQGEFDEVRPAIAEARSILGETPSTLVGAWVAYAEGEALAEADVDRALDALGEALDLARDGSLHFIAGVAGLTRAGLQVRHGEPADAVLGLVDLLGQWVREGADVQLAITLRLVIDLLVAERRYRDAAVLLGGVLANTAAEATGADAERLASAGLTIDAELEDAAALRARGAVLSLADLAEAANTALDDVSGMTAP